jgi:hypothetical protein
VQDAYAGVLRVIKVTVDPKSLLLGKIGGKNLRSDVSMTGNGTELSGVRTLHSGLTPRPVTLSGEILSMDASQYYNRICVVIRKDVGTDD